MDIYVKGGAGEAYVLEMQATDTKELPKRSRHYQSITDLQLLDKGIPYKEINRNREDRKASKKSGNGWR